MRIGLALSRKDLPLLAAERLDMVLIPAGVPLSEEDVAHATGCSARNLNRFAAQGAIRPASRRLAPLIRRFMATLVNPPVQAMACQNDVYQYHLRLQFYFLVALQSALASLPDPILILASRPYSAYWSPMRPDLGRLHESSRVYALLATRLAARLEIPIEQLTRRPRLLGQMEILALSAMRKVLLEGYRLSRLAVKCLRARKDARLVRRVAPGPHVRGPVAIVVRTDSEVLSALPLCSELKSRGVPYLIIQDELLGSQTARARLVELDLPFVSIGAMRGLPGLLHAWLKKPRKVKCAARPASPDADSAAATIDTSDIWKQMGRRLLDFSLDQTHFAMELGCVLDAIGPSGLVTYAYLDQWGPVIRECGRKRRLRTIAVQNAALDPEEYPGLIWADHFCVESLAVKKQLEEMNYPAHLLTATGLPQFAGNLPSTVRTADERLGFRTIVVLTQPIYPELFDAIIRACADVAAKHEMRVVVKLHPRQDSTDYESAIAYGRSLAPLLVVQREPLDEVLGEATVAVSVVSAALFRAIFLGVPTFSQLPIEEHHLDLYYVRHPVTCATESDRDLREGLSSFLQDYPGRFRSYLDSRSSFLAEHAVFEPTPNPTRNIADVVLEQIGAPAS